MVQHTSIRRISIQTAFGLALSACLASLAPAQSYYGGLRGTVVDPNGGAIANARVKIADQGTGAVRTTLSGTEGAFLFSEVVPGTYTVEVESPGFKKFSGKDVAVGTQQQISLDLKLEVGAVTESIMVTESVPLLENANASQGQVLDNQKADRASQPGPQSLHAIEAGGERDSGGQSGL